MSRRLFYILLSLAALYMLGLQYFFKNEGKFLFKTAAVADNSSYTFQVPFQEINLPINRNVNLHGIWFKQNEPKGLVLLFPAEDFDLNLFQPNQNPFYVDGFDLLIPAYRGTAKSSGKFIDEVDVYSDAQQWYKYANSQFEQEQIIVEGISIGTAAATFVATKFDPDALVIINPKADFRSFAAKKKFWWAPYRLFSFFPLNTIEQLKNINCKLVLVSENEELIDEFQPTLKPTDEVVLSIHPETENIIHYLNLK